MNKTELLRRYRWLWAILPIVSILGFYIVFLASMKNWIPFPVPGWIREIVHVAVRFVPFSWLALTISCSAAVAFVWCQKIEFRGVVRIIVLILGTVMLTAAQVIACATVLIILSEFMRK